MGLLDPRVGERKGGRQCRLGPFEWAGLSRERAARLFYFSDYQPTASEWAGEFFEEFEC